MSRKKIILIIPQIMGAIYLWPFCTSCAPWMGFLCPLPPALGCWAWLPMAGDGTVFVGTAEEWSVFLSPTMAWRNIWPLGRAAGTGDGWTPCFCGAGGGQFSWERALIGMPGPLGEDTWPLKKRCSSLGMAVRGMHRLWESTAYPLIWL